MTKFWLDDFFLLTNHFAHFFVPTKIFANFLVFFLRALRSKIPQKQKYTKVELKIILKSMTSVGITIVED